MKIEIFRVYKKDITLGSGYLVEGGRNILSFKTLELPWLNNQRRVSCIPEGTYKAIPHTSPKFGKTLWLQTVPGRSEILIHSGNFTRDTLGCILPGKQHIDIDRDGTTDVISSRIVMNQIIAATWTKKEIEVEISSSSGPPLVV